MLIWPDVVQAEEASRQALSHHKVLFIVGKCTVDYAGRAKSKLEPGDRILMVKADGSVLVHRSTCSEPVNWMPGGKVISQVQSTEGKLQIRVVRKNPSESLVVSFERIQLLAELGLIDHAEFALYSSEQDMQKALLLNPELLEKGFKIISWEKKVEPGFIDVYGTDSAGRLVVVEIKRKTAGKEAVFQLARYIEAVKSRADREVRGILAAPDIGKDVQRILATCNLEYKHLDPRKCAETIQRAENKKLAEYFEKISA